jgi:DNA adenine methylase
MPKAKEPHQNTKPRPFIKWVGGKRQLLDMIDVFKPESFGTYFEPFVGGGSVLFHLLPEHAIIGDTNGDLIRCYQAVKDHPVELIDELSLFQKGKNAFYAVRNVDRDRDIFESFGDIQRAARLIYLNKTCFNGYYRVNGSGFFNTPFAGTPRYVDIVNEDVILADHDYLFGKHIQIIRGDFALAVAGAVAGDFVYFDPPYHVEGKEKAFNGYGMHPFDEDEQKRLAALCVELTNRGVYVMVSNSSTDFIRDLYPEPMFKIATILASRSINSKIEKRGDVEEFLITNY